MGFRFRKSKSFGPFRVNLSKSGIGWSVGGKGFRYTKKAGGGTRMTASIPGTGISYVQDYSDGKQRRSSEPSAPIPPSSNLPPRSPLSKGGGCLLWGISIFLILYFFVFFISLTGVLCLIAGLLLLPVASWQNLLSKFLPFGKKTKAIISGVLFLLAMVFYGIPATAPAQAGAHSTATPEPTPIATPSPLPENTPTPDPTPTPTVEPTPTIEPTPTVEPTPTAEPAPTVEPVPTVAPADSSNQTPFVDSGAVVATEPAAPTPEPVSEATPEPDTQSGMVWIAGSGNGKKYHSYSGCSNMNNPIEISLSEAQSRGYEPCKKCMG